MPRSIRSVLVVGAFLLTPSVAQAASRPCPDARSFTCTRISLPLDRTGTVPGRIGVRYATETGRRPKKKVLLALTGGPGQPGVPFGPSYAGGFAGVLDEHRLVVLDQRGTGGSSVLRCPGIQELDALEPIKPSDVAGCAERVGPRRNSFASIDSADDIEAVRRRLGVDQLAIYGVSYGTWVAQQYARRYPDRVERLILDSVVAADADPWDTRIIGALPRVLGQLCAGRACHGISADPFADLTAVVHRIRAGGPRTATIGTRAGGRRRGTLSQVDLLYVLVASDLNPFLRSRIPGALAAGARGDYAPLIRLKKDAGGPVTPVRQFSGGLFVTTTCLDNELPYSYADPFGERAAKAAAALAALPEASIAPFDHAAIDVSSVPQICLRWPDGVFRAESTAPMPAVPTLILSGLADLRTPLEAGRALAAEVAGSQVVTLRGAGHDVFDSDSTGCVDVAIRRFFAGRPVGSPCRGRSMRPRILLTPPRSLAQVEPVPGLPAQRGRVLRAAVATVGDAWTSDNEAYYAGFRNTGGGGLRGGGFDSIPTGRGQRLVLRRLEFVPGVRVSGSVVADGRRLDGRIRVSTPSGRPEGTVVLAGGRVRARIGGRTLRTSLGDLLRARLARAAAAAFRAR